MDIRGITNRIGMGLGVQEASLRIEVIGNDGIRRTGYCSRQDTMAFNKYRIDPDGVFLTEIPDAKGNVRYEPTIVFYENSTECVQKGERSNPSPQEAGEAISQAAFSLARLSRQKNEQDNKISLYLSIGTLVCAAVGAYFAFRGMADIGWVGDVLTNYVTGISTSAPAATAVPTAIPAAVPTAIPAPTLSGNVPILPPRV